MRTMYADREPQPRKLISRAFPESGEGLNKSRKRKISVDFTENERLKKSPRRSVFLDLTEDDERVKKTPKRKISWDFTDVAEGSKEIPKRKVSLNFMEVEDRLKKTPKRKHSYNFMVVDDGLKTKSPRRSVSVNLDDDEEMLLSNERQLFSRSFRNSHEVLVDRESFFRTSSGSDEEERTSRESFCRTVTDNDEEIVLMDRKSFSRNTSESDEEVVITKKRKSLFRSDNEEETMTNNRRKSFSRNFSDYNEETTTTSNRRKSFSRKFSDYDSRLKKTSRESISRKSLEGDEGVRTPRKSFSRNEIDVFQDYEFVGDSHLVRLMTFFGMNKTNEKYPKRLGVAQGGAEIKTIHANLQECQTNKRKAIVCAGTNDLLKMFQRTHSETEYFDQLTRIKACLKEFYNTLTNEFNQIIWIQIPPILRLQSVQGYSFAFQSLNKTINAFSKLRKGIQVVNVSKVFKEASNNLSEFYEEFMGFGVNRRPDLIHINRRGMRHLGKALRDSVRRSGSSSARSSLSSSGH